MIEKTTIVDVKLIKREPIQEGKIEKFLRERWHKKPAPLKESTFVVRVTCGLEPKQLPDGGGEYYTLWMTEDESKPLTEVGINPMLVLMPFRRCNNLDVTKTGIDIIQDTGLEPVTMCG